MAEKWQRMFLRTVRALRDLRRYAGPVLIQNAGQVNVASRLRDMSSPAPTIAWDLLMVSASLR